LATLFAEVKHRGILPVLSAGWFRC
jgi:hypothetical protein